MMEHVSVDLDRISTRAAELAVSFGVPAPRVVAGTVPQWMTEGLRAHVGRGQPITVGANFGKLSLAEQDGALAGALLAQHLYRAGWAKPLAAAMLPAMLVGLPLVYIASYHGAPGWLVIPALPMTFVLGHIAAFAIRSRRIVYQIDRTVAEVLGRPVMDSMLDLDIRARPSFHFLVRLFLAVYSPTETQRAKRLDTVSHQGRTAAG